MPQKNKINTEPVVGHRLYSDEEIFNGQATKCFVVLLALIACSASYLVVTRSNIFSPEF